MERKRKLDVYLIASPFENSEGNVAASYLLHNENITSENQVIELADDCSIVTNSDISIVDKDRNSTILNTKSTDVATEQCMVEVLEKLDNDSRTSLHDHQVNSFTEEDSREKVETCAFSERYVDTLNISAADIENQENSKRNELSCETQLKEVSIFKPIASTTPEQDANFVMPCEESVACGNVNILDYCEVMEVSIQTEIETLLDSKTLSNYESEDLLDLTCKYCLKVYTCKDHRNRHIRRVHNILLQNSSDGNDLDDKPLEATSILKPIATSLNQDNSVMLCEKFVACRNVRVLDNGEAMEMSTQTEDEFLLNSENVKIEDLTCKYCLKIYSCKSLRNRHVRNFHKVIYKKTSNENELVENQLQTDILKLVDDATTPNQDAESMVTCENPVACSNVNVLGEGEEMEVCTQEEDEACLISEGIEIDDLTCKYCLKKYKRKAYKYKHLRVHHKMFNKIERHIRCIECDIIYVSMEKLREHLQMTHNLNMEVEEIYLPNMNAFYKWKHEVQCRDLASFRIKRKEKISDQIRRYFFICQQSGKYEHRLSGPRKQMLRPKSIKLESLCTATMFCEERANEVYVKYYRHHYGHGDNMPLVKPSAEEQNAAPENESFDIPFEKLLDDIRGSTSKVYYQMNLTKKKDVKFIRKTFNSEEYLSGLSDAESVERWVCLCSQMEDSPVLFYKREEEEFVLVIMTEFQKHILLSSNKQIVSVDSIGRRLSKSVFFYLTYIFVMDECEVAFPVAFCISNKVDKNVIKQFLMCIRESTGPLSYTYFVSDWKKHYYEAWVEVMNIESKWLWSLWYIDNRHGYQIRGAFTNDVSSDSFRGNFCKRADIYKKFRMMLECQNPSLFETMFTNYVELLQNDPQSKNLGNSFLKKYGSNKEIWANCYQKDLKLSTLISMELLHRTLRYCCVEGRKTQRLDTFIFVIMKLVRYKMLARLTNMLDSEKMDLAIDAIDQCHRIGLDISTDRISSISDKIWLIRSDAEEEDVYITCEFDACPELCSLRCSECDICVHMFSCSCMQNLINANLCQHIHAIVFKFLRPHFSPINSPVRDDSEDFESIDIPSMTPSELLIESALKKTHDVYTQIRSNKCTLSQESLNFLIKRLNDCLDICSGQKVNENKSTNTEPPPPEKKSMFIPTSPKPSSQTFMPQNTFPTSELTTLAQLPQNQLQSRYFLVVQNNDKRIFVRK